MSRASGPDTEELLRRAATGDGVAVDVLFDRHRPRLRKMVAVWMDPRLSTRVDPSDVIQETLTNAFGHLSHYLRERPLPFYPWLRQFAWNRLVDLHRRHVLAGRRSVLREDKRSISVPDGSAERLVHRLSAKINDPGCRIVWEEMRDRVRAALEELPSQEREILVMRNLEQLPIKEIAAIQGVPEGTVKSRQFRALESLRSRLAGDLDE